MKKIMLFFAVACILAACNNDNEVLNETQYITEFKADFAATRMTATPDNGLKFAWEEGDVLYVFQADDATVNYKYYEYDAATQTFKATTSADALEAGKQYFAANHIRNNAEPFTIVDAKIQFKAKLNNSKDVTKIPLISDVFTATADATIAAMHHTVGVVEVPVLLHADSTIDQLKNLGFYVSGGKVTLDFIATPASPYFVAADPGYDTAWANQEKTLSKSTEVSFFVPMFPGTYTNPAINYQYSDYTDQALLTGTLTVECGKVTKLPTQTLKLTLE